MRQDAVHAILFDDSADTGNVTHGVHDAGADLVVAIHLSLFILCQEEFERSDQTHDLFLRGLGCSSYPLIRAAVEHGSPNQIFSSSEYASALWATDSLPTTKIH